MNIATRMHVHVYNDRPSSGVFSCARTSTESGSSLNPHSSALLDRTYTAASCAASNSSSYCKWK